MRKPGCSTFGTRHRVRGRCWTWFYWLAEHRLQWLVDQMTTEHRLQCEAHNPEDQPPTWAQVAVQRTKLSVKHRGEGGLLCYTLSCAKTHNTTTNMMDGSTWRDVGGCHQEASPTCGQSCKMSQIWQMYSRYIRYISDIYQIYQIYLCNSTWRALQLHWSAEHRQLRVSRADQGGISFQIILTFPLKLWQELVLLVCPFLAKERQRSDRVSSLFSVR